jgi:Flp pilus assembly pilin Flp
MPGRVRRHRRRSRGHRPDLRASVRRRRDAGQAAVEFALVLPLVATLVLGVVQLIVVARDQLAVELAARDGARAAAVSAAPAPAARAAAERAITLRPLDVDVTVDGDRVTVRVAHRTVADVPLVGIAIGDVEVAASVTMLREPP